MSYTAEVAELAWGYTMADVDRLARRVVNGSRSFGNVINASDRWEDAWFGIVERLYSAMNAAPTVAELLEAGRDAVGRQLAAHAQNHGLQWRDGEQRTNGGFDRFWRSVDGGDDFTERIAEREALPQVLGLLSAEHYETVVALATYGNIRGAAHAIGISESGFKKRLAHARRQIIAAWLAPESPPEAHDPNRCGRGHSRAEYGYINTEGNTACRKCQRLADRRHYRRTVEYDVDDAA